MRKILPVVALFGLACLFVGENESGDTVEQIVGHSESSIAAAFGSRRSDVQVQGSGVVVRVLRDDIDGARHQRFILRLGTGQTLLVAHNIDLAPRLEGLEEGDVVEFFGEYEWNDKGGVIHWTHRDPRNQHVAGWLKHRGRTYQ